MKKRKQPELRAVEEDSDESVLRLNVEGGEKLHENRAVDEKELDQLFSERKPSRYDDDIGKALAQPKISHASLMRMKSGEATKVTLAELQANNKTLEDEWEDENREDKSLPTVIKVIFINVIVILVCLGGFAVWKIFQSNEGKLSNELVKRKEQREQVKQSSSNALGGVMAAETVIESYFKTDILDARLPLIYRGQELKEQIVAYEAKNPAVAFHDMKLFGVGPAEGHSDDIWVGRFKHGMFNMVDFVYLRSDSHGDFEVDWTSRAGVPIDDIEKFTSSQDTEPKLFRFKIKQKFDNGFYNWGFTDKEYAAVELTVPGVEKTFYGYIPLLDKALLFEILHYFEDLDKLNAMNIKGGNQVILKVRFLENSDPNNTKCFVIDELVSRSWLFEDEAEYERDAKATKDAEPEE